MLCNSVTCMHGREWDQLPNKISALVCHRYPSPVDRQVVGKVRSALRTLNPCLYLRYTLVLKTITQ